MVAAAEVEAVSLAVGADNTYLEVADIVAVAKVVEADTEYLVVVAVASLHSLDSLVVVAQGFGGNEEYAQDYHSTGRIATIKQLI